MQSINTSPEYSKWDDPLLPLNCQDPTMEMILGTHGNIVRAILKLTANQIIQFQQGKIELTDLLNLSNLDEHEKADLLYSIMHKNPEVLSINPELSDFFGMS